MAEQTGVVRLTSVHFGTLPNRRPSMNRPRRATEIPEEPYVSRSRILLPASIQFFQTLLKSLN